MDKNRNGRDSKQSFIYQKKNGDVDSMHDEVRGAI